MFHKIDKKLTLDGETKKDEKLKLIELPNWLNANVDGREIMLDNAEGLLKDLSNGILDGQEFKKKYNDIVNDAQAISLLLPKEILKLKESDEHPDPKDMLELESEKFTLEGKPIKILTSDQTLSTLSITSAQLKARNNFEKLKNEIRQLLHSSYRSKKLTKTIYNNLINAIYKNGDNLYEH